MLMLEPELLALSHKATMSYIAKGSGPQKELQLWCWKPETNLVTKGFLLKVCAVIVAFNKI